jgi:hypothetical protein
MGPPPLGEGERAAEEKGEGERGEVAMGGIEGQLVIGLSVLVLVWYFLGQQALRRRGLAVLQWVRAGVSILGESPKLRWLGSAAFQLTIEHPAPPFKALSVTVVLAPREIFFLWLVNRFRKRRDLMVVRGDVTTRPRVRFELFREEGRSGQEAKAIATSERWPIVTFDKSGLRLATSSPLGQDLLHTAMPRMADHLAALLRLSIRDASPHLLFNYTLRPGQAAPAGPVFHALLDLARALLATHPV